jgi:hypothetical protein
MLNIENKNKFGKVIADSIAKVELTVKDAQTKKRWINAISKAAAQIDNHGEFMNYDTQDNHLVIWSQDSNEIYTSNGVCQCKAFAQNQPCWHRAAARLVRFTWNCRKTPTRSFPQRKRKQKKSRI